MQREQGITVIKETDEAVIIRLERQTTVLNFPPDVALAVGRALINAGSNLGRVPPWGLARSADGGWHVVETLNEPAPIQGGI